MNTFSTYLLNLSFFTDYFQIPSELLAGNKLQIFERSGNVNLYDLAESITFVDIDNLSQYQDEIGSETTQELHDM